jgi:hypothetical protein
MVLLGSMGHGMPMDSLRAAETAMRLAFAQQGPCLMRNWYKTTLCRTARSTGVVVGGALSSGFSYFKYVGVSLADEVVGAMLFAASA